jgi:hypothetical protein
MTDHIWLYLYGRFASVEFTTRKGRSISSSVLADSPVTEYEGRILEGFLGYLGAAWVANRYPVSIYTSDLDEARTIFESLCQRGNYFDCAWINLVAFHTSTSSMERATEYTVALVTATQLSSLNKFAGPSVDVRLTNGQILTTVDMLTDDRVARHWTVEMQPLRYATNHRDVPVGPEEIELQTMPSLLFQSLVRKSHSYNCVLNRAHKRKFGHRYLQVRNHLLETDYRHLQAHLPVVPKYEDSVPGNRIVLDASTMLGDWDPKRRMRSSQLGEKSGAIFAHSDIWI